MDLVEARVLCNPDELRNLFKSEHPAHGNYEYIMAMRWIRSGRVFGLFHLVKRTVRCLEQAFDRCAILWVNRDSDTDGKPRLFGVIGQPFANPAADCVRLFVASLRQNNCEFVATVTGRCVNRPTGETKNIGQAAQSPVTSQMAVAVVNSLHSIQIKNEHRKGPCGAIRAFDL